MKEKPVTNAEFMVDDCSGQEHAFKTFDEAAGYALIISASTGEDVNIDLCCYDRNAAAALGVLEEYDLDPDASVTQRMVVHAEFVGHIS